LSSKIIAEGIQAGRSHFYALAASYGTEFTCSAMPLNEVTFGSGEHLHVYVRDQMPLCCRGLSRLQQ
jgi:hypothetical protein